jgi:hypothetical protein
MNQSTTLLSANPRIATVENIPDAIETTDRFFFLPFAGFFGSWSHQSPPHRIEKVFGKSRARGRPVQGVGAGSDDPCLLLSRWYRC